jgi:hypothetical protein
MSDRIMDRNWTHYDFHHVVFEPRHMSAEALQAGHDWVVREFYRPRRLARRLSRVARWPDGLSMMPYVLALNLAPISHHHDKKRNLGRCMQGTGKMPSCRLGLRERARFCSRFKALSGAGKATFHGPGKAARARGEPALSARLNTLAG